MRIPALLLLIVCVLKSADDGTLDLKGSIPRYLMGNKSAVGILDEHRKAFAPQVKIPFTISFGSRAIIVHDMSSGKDSEYKIIKSVNFIQLGFIPLSDIETEGMKFEVLVVNSDMFIVTRFVDGKYLDRILYANAPWVFERIKDDDLGFGKTKSMCEYAADFMMTEPVDQK